MTPPCHDAIVIGAGPAGATAACLLARQGADVLLLDRALFPRPKLCAGLLTWKTIRLLEKVFKIPLASLKESGVIGYESRDYGIQGTRGYLLKGRLDFPFHYIDRLHYDQFWLGQARFAGARARLGERVSSVDPDSGLVVTAAGNRYRGRFVIAADGARSRARTCLAQSGSITLPAGRQRQMATALEIFLPRRRFSWPADEANIYLGYVPWGYAWSFPGKENQTVGICALKGLPARGLRNGLIKLLGSMGVPAAQALQARAAPLPFGNFLKTAGHGRVLLAGDAAGFADPLLGEGIYYAHQSGHLAAASVAAFFDRPAGVLPEYRRLLDRIVFRELENALRWRFVLHRLCGTFDYAPFPFLARAVQKPIEEAVQGRRSFAWLRRI